MDVFIAGTDAALELLKVSDPEGHYVAKTVHNPNPLKKKIDDKIREVRRWAVSN